MNTKQPKGKGRPRKPESAHAQFEAVPRAPRIKMPKADPLAASGAENAPKKRSRQSPLSYILELMRDASLDRETRLLCARLALPFAHADKRHTEAAAKPEKLGKKEVRLKRALRACDDPSSKFRTPPGPSMPPHRDLRAVPFDMSD